MIAFILGFIIGIIVMIAWAGIKKWGRGDYESW